MPHEQSKGIAQDKMSVLLTDRTVIKNRFAVLLKKKREEKNFTHYFIAKFLDFHVQSVKNYEIGASVPFERAVQLCHLLDIDLNTFLECQFVTKKQ